ncbi:MAG: HAMP domain-containing histidine kinase, partial [Planctomycetes bacterium]|nr:HAMP domain-containing histidine kinase [Planctomycetota bacterium]
LTRLLAVEIARPSSFYRSFYVTADMQGGKQQRASPLLMQPSPYVRLHFEVRPGDRWSSPQCPEQQQYDAALANDATVENIDRSNRRLQELSSQVSQDDLLAHLPEQNVEPDLLAQNSLASNNALMPPQQGPKMVKNVLDFQPVQQQLETVQTARPAEFEDFVPQAAGPNAYSEARNQRLQQRRGNELQNRNEAFQAAAQQAIVDQYFNYSQTVSASPEILGVSQPLWVGSRLLLARRVEASGQTLVQGCWLDWPRIKKELLDRIAPILPQADLEPVDDLEHVRFSRVLATLPVQLVVPDPAPLENPLSPLRISLLIAWGFMTMATLAMAVLLRGVVTLSERRAAFVSAVTHELRTPLTTFRMYAEMLAEGMVTDEGRQAEYLETLKVEADRLTHLVENVLQYARLERGSRGRRRETVSVGALLTRIQPRLQDRANQADMIIRLEAEDSVRAIQVATDPSAVEQILFNLVDNACKYAQAGEDRRIHCRVESTPREVRIAIQDHGPGIRPGEVRRLFRPFSKSAQAAADSAPGVGLGLALSRRLAGQLGGRLEVCGGNGVGATFTLRLPRATGRGAALS